MSCAGFDRELASGISARLEQCSLDELRVLDVLLARLELGRSRYGHLDLARDQRDFRAEGAEELADLAIYRACDYLAKRDDHRDRIELGLAELRDAEAVTSPRERFDLTDIDHSEGG